MLEQQKDIESRHASQLDHIARDDRDSPAMGSGKHVYVQKR